MILKKIHYLSAAYIFSLIMTIVGFSSGFNAKNRAIILVGANIPIVLTHVGIILSGITTKKMKGFLVLTSLCIIKFVISLTQIRHVLFGSSDMVGVVLDCLDLALLLVIAITVSLSFLIKKPFFFEHVKNKTITILGIILLLASLSFIVFFLLALNWFYNDFLPSVAKPR